MIKKIFFVIVILIISSVITKAQELLTKKDAVKMALDSNYSIRIAEKNVLKSQNNTSIFNTDYLPKVTVNSGVNVTNNNIENEFQDGTIYSANNANTANINASLGASYTLFDGFGRSYNYQKLQKMYKLSELDARLIIENTVLQLFIAYYEVAKYSENQINLQSSLEISEKRLERAKYNYEYGKNTKLDVLNAEVDYNNDKIRYLSIKKQLANSKHNLNLILGRNINTNFKVDRAVEYELILNIDSLLTNSKKYNVQILQAQKNIEISNFIIKESKARWLPIINLSGAYSYNRTNSDTNYAYAYNMTNGLNAGINLQWNIFDGGRTKIAVQNSKITVENSKIQKINAEQNLERDVRNLWEAYNNSLFILKAEQKNVETNKINFARTEEQYKLGQISSIEYRLAQLNLLNALTNYNEAKYDAKITELQLLQLSGTLLNSNF